ncbi:TonB-dependent receptor [Parabacteroides sp.]|uniref:TonB-dependent receptor n=1 Tax=Parabacteroides sp. TaxID=1869337 RepID=UPI0030801779
MMIFVLSGLQAQTNGVDETRKVTLNMQKASVREILDEIQKQAGVTFSYESSLLSGLPKTTFRADDEALENCLTRLFANLPVVYKMTGRIVVLKRKPKQVTVSGFVRDKRSAESLIGASVYESGSRVGTASNNFGFFSLTLPGGDITIRASYIGYTGRLYNLTGLERDTVLTIELEPSASLQEVVVTGQSTSKQSVLSTQMGALEINQQTIRSTPVMFGEADIIKTLLLTPGVSSGTEGTAGMYVRGGNVDENLFLIDGNPVYQINHIGGIFSAFNPEAISGMDFFKSGFPSRYGGRLSSVVDVHMKEGNMKEYHGSATLGLISGNLNFEGPIVKDRTSFNISLRRTWLDVLSAPALAIANKITKKDGIRTRARYAFHDLNLKVNHIFNDRSRMYFSLYNGNDVLKGGSTDYPSDFYSDVKSYNYDTDVSLRWGNIMATTGWTYVFNNRLFGKFSGVFTRYHSKLRSTELDIEGKEGESGYSERFSENSTNTGIMDLGVRTSFDYLPVHSHHIRFGGDYLVHRFRPEYNRSSSFDKSQDFISNINKEYANDLLWGHEAGVFAEDDWTLLPSVRINAGVRFSLFNVQGKTYTGVEPRVSLRWLLADNLSFKASYSRMNQYVHLISNSFISLPTDAWMPVTRKLKPLLSDQVSAGFYYDLNKTYSFSVEGYYKTMENLLEYRDGHTFTPSYLNWEDKLTAGDGRAYGAEFMVRKETGRTTGWIGYGLSWADRKFDELNLGERYPARFDNRHKLNIVVMHKISPKVEISAAWSYASGNHVTLSLENYMENGSLNYVHGNGYDLPYTGSWGIDYYEGRNNYQLPAYHRLDLGIKIYRPKKKGRMGIWTVSIYNVYSRMNPFMIHKTDKEVRDPSSSYGYKVVPVFKTVGIMPIIPSVSYTYKF